MHVLTMYLEHVCVYNLCVYISVVVNLVHRVHCSRRRKASLRFEPHQTNYNNVSHSAYLRMYGLERLRRPGLLVVVEVVTVVHTGPLTETLCQQNIHWRSQQHTDTTEEATPFPCLTQFTIHEYTVTQVR